MEINLQSISLLESTDPLLTCETEKFDFNDPPIDPQLLVNQMLTVMAEQNGIGLAANQIGVPYSVFVCAGDPFACFNPVIVDYSSDEVALDEGCLTWPGLYVSIKRPSAIRVRFTNIKGEVETHKYNGMTARIIQHEMDHLAGKLFYNRSSKYHRDKAFRKHKTYLRHPGRFTKKEIVRS
jgi:peptide deformylase